MHSTAPLTTPRAAGFVSMHSQGVRRRSSQITPPPNASAFVEIRVDNDDSSDDDDSGDDFDDASHPKDTDSLIPRRSSSTAVPAFHGRRISNGTFNGLPAISEKREAMPLEGGYLLYTSVLITVLLGPQLGWEIAQLNFRAFHNSNDCAQKPVQPGKCIIFPGHSDVEWVVAVMCWVLGAAFGALFTNIPAEKYGRRFVVITNACFMILGAALQSFAPNIWVFALGRFFNGVASGSGSMITSLYLGEIGPPHQRAGFVIAFQCTGSMGIVAITIVHFAVTDSATSWRWVMAFPMVLGALQLLMAPLFLIESPKWLLHQNRSKDAASAFHALYKRGSFQDLERLVKIEQEKARRRELATAANEKVAATGSFCKDAFSSRCKRQFIISCILCTARQFGGVSAVFYYSSGIFAKAGIEDSRAGNLILGIVNMLAAVVVCACSKRLARRKVLLGGISGMIICSIGMTFCLVYKHPASIAFTALYVTCNSLSLSPLPFLVTAEVLPEDIKARGISIATFINWMCNLIVGIGFPVLAHYTGSYTFIPFTCLLVVFWVCVFVMLPETRDKTNEQIQQEFANHVGFLASFKKSKKLEEEEEEAVSAAAASQQQQQQQQASGIAPVELPRGPRRTSVGFVVPMAPAMSSISRTA